MWGAILSTDSEIIDFFKKIRIPLARFAIFFVFFYFGLLKVIGLSPANPLVDELLHATMPLFSGAEFIPLFGALEMLIGLLFLLPGMERLAIGLLFPHLAATILPLIILPHATWESIFVPTLEGQYILKNIVLVSLAVVIGSGLAPLSSKTRKIHHRDDH